MDLNGLYNKLMRIFRNSSFRSILLFTFLFVTIAPILLFQYFSYIRLNENFRQNMNDITKTNIQNIRNNLSIMLDAYDSILYQVYTNDDIIALAKDIDAGKALELSKNKLRRTLQGLCYAKDGIESIMIITAGGTAFYYDKLTGSNTTSSWLGKVGLTREYVERFGSRDYSTGLLPTQYAYSVGGERHYLFHMTHRLIDYKAVDKEIGVAVLTLSEDLLRGVCDESHASSFSFIIDSDGRIITYPARERIGEVIGPGGANPYLDLLKQDGYWTSQTELFYSDPVRNWRLVSVADLSAFDIQNRRRLIGDSVIGLSVLLVSVLIIMMKRVMQLVDEVQAASNKRRDAEIKALEAQLNPHFLYNILDSINWMAVDGGQLEISRMITALAKIMRYSISKSNAVVPLRTELEWLKQYVDLQSVRFKESFELVIEADEALMDIPIRKLIIQPFIENAILHGLKNIEGYKCLTVRVNYDDGLLIRIQDNGKGMGAEKLKSILDQPDQSEDHIGILNAVGRIRMYYGEDVEFHIESEPGTGTEVSIRLRRLKLSQEGARG